MRVDSAGNFHIAGDAMYFDTIAGNDYIDFDESTNYMRIVQDAVERFRLGQLGHIQKTRPLGGDVYQNATQSLTNGGWTNLNMNTTRSDVHSDIGTTGIFTVPTDGEGLYMFGASCRIDTDPTDFRIGVLHNTGASYETSDRYDGTTIGSLYLAGFWMRDLAAGNTLRPRVFVNHASTSTVANTARFYCARIA